MKFGQFAGQYCSQQIFNYKSENRRCLDQLKKLLILELDRITTPGKLTDLNVEKNRRANLSDDLVSNLASIWGFNLEDIHGHGHHELVLARQRRHGHEIN